MARSAKRSTGGPVPPYGTAIRDAIARGTVQEMNAVAEEARRALYSIRFTKVTSAQRADVLRALGELEEAIKNLEAS